MLLVFVATKRAVFCWQFLRSRACSDNLSALPTSVYAIWLAPHGPFCRARDNHHTCHIMAFYNHVPHFSVVGNLRVCETHYQWCTGQMGQFALGEKPCVSDFNLYQCSTS